MIRTCLLGLGRTGMVVAEHLIKSPDFELVSVFMKPHSLKVDHQLNNFMNVNSSLIIKDTNAIIAEVKNQKIQVAVDFTNPKAVLKNARVLAGQGVHIRDWNNWF